jgi:hypothetical protein
VKPCELRVSAILADVLRHPVRHFITNWNWKASLTSAICRGVIFYALNTPAGLDWATRAMVTEFAFRAAASGVLGSLTQALRFGQPRYAALLILPGIGHLAEYIVHRQAGTPRLAASVIASIAFSVLTTAFNLFAMRRGVLIVGPGRQSLRADLARLPALIVAFVAAAVPRGARNSTRPSSRASHRAIRACPCSDRCFAFDRCRRGSQRPQARTGRQQTGGQERYRQRVHNGH